jgi:hypothetical protein
LVAHPGAEIHVLELANPGQTQAPNSDAGPQLDAQARQAYRERLTALQDQLETTEELGDVHGADKVRGEIEFLGKELSRAVGLGGRQRKAGSAAERARVNVQRRISDAIKRVKGVQPEIGKYLDLTIKTGAYCSYSPM